MVCVFLHSCRFGDRSAFHVLCETGTLRYYGPAVRWKRGRRNGMAPVDHLADTYASVCDISLCGHWCWPVRNLAREHLAGQHYGLMANVRISFHCSICLCDRYALLNACNIRRWQTRPNSRYDSGRTWRNRICRRRSYRSVSQKRPITIRENEVAKPGGFGRVDQLTRLGDLGSDATYGISPPLTMKQTLAI